MGSYWAEDPEALFAASGSDASGLTEAEAVRRLAANGPNAIEPHRGHRGARLLAAQFTSPIIMILVAATALSIVLGDVADGSIILVIIVASGALGFWQEHTAGRAVDALLSQVRVRAEVLRDGVEVAVPVDRVVVGDVVVLRAGDIVPGDGRVVASRSLLVDESALTGESIPVEKSPVAVAADAPMARRSSAVFAGAHVVSGTATMLVMATGGATALGALAADLDGRRSATRFERGITAFGLLLVRAMVVLVTAILVINVVLGRPLIDSVLFSLALAVGLTPQLLPAIVAISLSTGARAMAAEQVIVKRLDAIEDFGTMTVLCTDKTGTLTVGAARLDLAVDLAGRASEEVLRLARLNAALQHGFPNPLDAAILAGAPPPDGLVLDEVPYDFTRKRLSVLVAGDPPLLVTKGACGQVLEIVTTAELDGRVVPIADVEPALHAALEELSEGGYRVIAVATRRLPGCATVTVTDESEMTLRGLLAFADPPKAGTLEAIGLLADLGVSVRLVTGDNRLAARHIAGLVGLPTDDVLTGDAIDALDDVTLARRAGEVAVFAEVEPLHKERIVRALQTSGETVGFLGDGINDAAALHAADVGISVDTAVDVAKQSAAIVLMDKSLGVVADGVRLGRRTFANTMKYVRVTTSANFGNMLSMAAAAAFLPFLPLLPRQILLLNFLSDVPGTTIAADDVDAEQLDRPHEWDIGDIRRFMIGFGLISSAFDLATFAVLRLVFDADAALFHSGWFIESTATELAVMLVLRTTRPFWRSRPHALLIASSAVVAVITVALPYTALAEPLGLVGVPLRMLAALAVLIVVYVGANELAKWRLRARALRRRGSG